MYLADYHLHSCISPDSDVSMTQMAETAVAFGLDELCFTDHIEPIQWGTTAPRETFDWAALTAEFQAAHAVMGERITLRLGMELGDAPWNIPHMEHLMADAPPLDFIIGSIHMLSPSFGGGDLYFFHPENEADAHRGIVDYLGQVKKLAEWGKFSVLGHLTLPLRYFNENRGFQLTFDGYEAEVEEIFRTLLQNGCGIELNTNRGNTPLPDAKWLRMYRELGGEIITLGTDAHCLRHIGCAVRENQQLLRECGFKRFCTFSKMRPIWHEL